MNFLSEDFDSLTALPLGIWQSDNECSFDDLSLHNTVHYDPVCTENLSDPASPNISKTYAELHVFPKQEADSASFLPLTSPFADITNTEPCDQSVCTVMQDENYSKEMVTSAFNPLHFGEVVSTNFSPDKNGGPLGQASHMHPLQNICIETQTMNANQRHVVRLTRNRATRRGTDSIPKEIPISIDNFTGSEQTSDDGSSLKELGQSTKGRSKVALKASQKSVKTRGRSKQSRRRKSNFEKEANGSDVFSDATSLGKKGKSFGKAKFKAEKWNMVFQRKAFLIRYSDVDFFDSNQIWCVVNHKVIRKYILDRCLPEGKRVYKKTNRLAGWLCNESQHYYPVEVIEVGKDYDEVTIIYPDIDALRMARNVSKIEESNDDRTTFSHENSDGSNDIMETKVEVIEGPEIYSQRPDNSAPSDTTDPWGTTLLEEEEEEEEEDDEDEVEEQ